MVFIWGSGWGGRRRGGYGPGFGRGRGPGYGRGYGPPPGYGYGPRYGGGGGGGSCLRDLLFLETGCCLAEMLGCGPGLFLIAPHAVRAVRLRGEERGTAARLIAAVRLYQREVSLQRPPCCRFTPTCSAYAVEALHRHGAGRGSWLTVRRLLRCRPGAVGGADSVPAAA